MAAQYEQPQGWLGKVQDFFNKANNVSVPVTPYTKAALDGTTQNPVSDFIDETVGRPFVNISNDYQQAGGGAQGVGAALRGDYDRSVDWMSRNVIEPPFYPAQMYQAGQQALNSALSGFFSGLAKGPEQAARDFQAQQAANHADQTVGDLGSAAPKVALSAAAPKVSLPAAETNGALSYLGNPALPSEAPIRSAAETNGALSYLGNKSVEAGLANRTKGADLVANQGFTQVDNLQVAPGNYKGNPFFRKTADITSEQLQKSDPVRYKALMELQALREADAAGQAKKYQQTGLTPPPIVTKDKFGAPVQTIMQPNAPVTGKSLNPNAPKPFDMNNMEEYKVEIPGKGWMTGLRQKDPNRQQGTLSITPGLSDSERAQVDQINANQARQAAYGVSRKTGELYDASLQHQQQQAALQALKQLQMQQEQAYQNKQLSLDERKALAAENQNAMTNEYNAGKLAVDRGNMLTQGNRYAQQSAHDRANRQDSFMKDHFRKWATESPAGLKSKNPWDDFAVTNLGVLSASARTNDPPKFATPYASKTAGMIDVVYPDGKVRTVPYIDYIDALSQPAQTAEEN